MADAAKKIARQGAEAMGAKLDTKIVKNQGKGRMTENVRQVMNKGAEMIGAKEKTGDGAAQMVEAAKKLVRKGSEDLGAKLDTQISKGVEGRQMVKNVLKMMDLGAQAVGAAEKKAGSNPIASAATELVSKGIDKLGAKLKTKISEGLSSNQPGSKVHEMAQQLSAVRNNQPNMRQVDLNA